MSSPRKPSTTYQSLQLLMNAETRHENIDWVKGGDTNGFIFRTPPLDIDADIETVWDVVKDVEHYHDYSNGAIDAHVDGEVEVGKRIGMDLYAGQCAGKLIPHSDEVISVVDDEHKVIGWERELPLISNPTERYQVLEALPENRTRSYIALRIPGYVGLFSRLAFKGTIEAAFTELHQGIKHEAENKKVLK